MKIFSKAFLAILLLLNITGFAQIGTDIKPLQIFRFEKDNENLPFVIKTPEGFNKSGLMWSTGRQGKENGSATFAGKGDGVKTNLDISPEKYPELSVTAWVFGRPEGVLTGTDYKHKYKAGTAYHAGTEKFTSRNLYFANGMARSDFQFFSKDQKKTFISSVWSAKLKENEWNFVAVVFNKADSSTTLYMNNEFYNADDVHKQRIKTYYADSPSHLIIGKELNNEFAKKFSGQVEEIRLYGKALTGDEIAGISGLKAVPAPERMKKEGVRRNAVILGLMAVFIIMIITMIVILIKGKKFKTVTVESIRQAREKAGAIIEDESATNELAMNYIEESFLQWPVVSTNAQGHDLRAPGRHKHFTNTMVAIKKALALYPTDKNTVDRINELGEFCNDLQKRRFYGNKGLVVLSLIIPVLMYFITGGSVANKIAVVAVFLLPTIAYIISNFTPAYLVAGRNSGRMHSVAGGILGILFATGAAVAAEQHLLKVTNLRSGYSHIEHDTASEAMGAGLGLLFLIAAIILGSVLTGFIAIIAFFRNYVFYV